MTDTKTLVVVGLGYGDEGKGSCVDYLAAKHQAHTVVRYNGGPQTAHNVTTDDGRHHTFAQFGSGTFVSGCRTHLSRYMLVNPENLIRENVHLAEIGETDALERLTIDRQALLVTPFHRAANVAREFSRGRGRHGTTAQGVGEAKADWLFHPHVSLTIEAITHTPARLRAELNALVEHKRVQLAELGLELKDWMEPRDATIQRVLERTIEFYGAFAKKVKLVDGDYLDGILGREMVIFEGAQGVLLDEDVGFHPHTTWSKTTIDNANQLSYGYDRRVVGVIRSYMTRHGAGPFVSENPDAINFPEPHNTGGAAGGFRQGYFDLVALNYALKAVHVDEIAVTHMDRDEKRPVCIAYRSEDPVCQMVRDLFGGPKDNVVDELFLQEKGSRGAMWAMTQFLMEMEPITHEYDSVLYALEDQGLEDKVSLLSYGPQRSDKLAPAYVL